jgi:hypothetical protein
MNSKVKCMESQMSQDEINALWISWELMREMLAHNGFIVV